MLNEGLPNMMILASEIDVLNEISYKEMIGRRENHKYKLDYRIIVLILSVTAYICITSIFYKLYILY